ncbi:MAG TPA: amidohydrolase [Acidobacteriaceae bacterium]
MKYQAFVTSCLAAAFLLTAPLCVSAYAQTSAPDVIFVHGDILTGTHLRADDKDPMPARVSALAIREGRVVAAGSDKDILTLKGAHTEVIDLRGAFAMPGFNDAHTHIVSAGMQRLSVNLNGAASLAEMQDRIRAYVATAKPGQWILGGGWDHTKWASGKLPTRQDLDAVTGDHPAVLYRVDGHIVVANTAALFAANISRETPDPDGGKIDRLPDGTATGIVRERPAINIIEAHVPQPDNATRRKALELSFDDALSHGVTSVQTLADWEDFLVLETMEKSGKLPMRVYQWLDFNTPLPVLDQRRLSHSADDPWLHMGMLKGYMDGSLGSRTAALNAPYVDDKDNSGIPRYEQSKLNELATARAAAGFQLGFHAIGDRANDMALNAMQAAEQVGVPADRPGLLRNAGAAVAAHHDHEPAPQEFRFRIEHAQVVSPGAFDRFHELGVIASMQPSHLLTDMAWAKDRIGPERAKYSYAWHSFLQHHVTLAFGTDYPVESINPFRGLYAAVTRMNEAGTATFEPQERLTIEEAIYAYTQASAFAEFREHMKGRLEPGFVGDLIVLDRDITKAEPQALLHTRVLRTVIAGKTVYTQVKASGGMMTDPPAHYQVEDE